MKLQPEFWLGQTVRVVRPPSTEDWVDYYLNYGSEGRVGQEYVIDAITYHEHHWGYYYFYALKGSNWHLREVLALVDSSTPHRRIPFHKPIKVRGTSTPLIVDGCRTTRDGSITVSGNNFHIKASELILHTTPIL